MQQTIPFSAEVLPIHFRVPENYILLHDFVETAVSVQKVVDNLCEQLFNNQISFEIIVLPPEAGSFKSRLALVVKKSATVMKIAGIIAGGACVFMESDLGQAYIKGLTGHEPSYWAEQVGEATKEILFENDEEEKALIIPEKAAASIVAESTKSFMQLDHMELQAKGVTKSKFRYAYEAKNTFYETCYSRKEISAIGFNDKEDFPIKRDQFPNFITDIPAPEEPEDLKDWKVEIRHIKVTSPNWDRADESRNWKGKYQIKRKEKYTTFTVTDDLFWLLVKNGDIISNGIDTLKVQWAYVEENGRRKYTRVLRVLEFNGQKLSEPLTDEQLDTLLIKYSIKFEDQGDLFK